MAKPVLLHFIDSLGKGGAEWLLVNTINRLPDYEHLVVYLNEPDDLSSEITSARLINLKVSNKSGFLRAILKIRSIVKQHKIDLIHSHSYWTNILTRLAAPSGTSVVNTYHFADYDTMRQKPSVDRMIKLDKFTYKPHHKLIAVSEYVNDILRKECGYQRVITLKNFVPEVIGTQKATPPINGQVLRLVAVGSLKKEKNYELIVEAFKQLKNEPITMDVYGGGANIEQFRDQVKEAGISNLCFKGAVSNVHEILPEYHVFIQASFSEACPLSPIEAVRAGLPQVLSDIKSLKEIMGEHALYFRNNDVNDLVNQLKNIVRHPEKLDYNNPHYQEILNDYSASTYLNNLTNIYNQLIIDNSLNPNK